MSDFSAQDGNYLTAFKVMLCGMHLALVGEGRHPELAA
jgi:hypothetical protein